MMRMDIRSTSLAMSSTKPMESMAPAKAARMSPQEDRTTARPSANTMMIATISLAPEPSDSESRMALGSTICPLEETAVTSVRY